MAYRWDKEGFPHKGWTLEDVYDVREDGQTAEDTNYEICMMCGYEQLRYVHVLSHPEVENDILVGCQCASRLTDDYKNPKERETKLKNKLSRRSNFLKRKWRVSDIGNEFLNLDGHHVLIFKDRRTGKFKVKIDDQFGEKLFNTQNEAKLAAFNGIEYYKERGEW